MHKNLDKLVKEWEKAIWKGAEFEIRRTREEMSSKISDEEFEELVFWLRNRMVESFHFGISASAISLPA
jgi:hypothetical protein